MKKILLVALIILISLNAFASMSECVDATKAENWKEAVESCKPLADKDNKYAIGLVARAYTELEDGKQAQKYFGLYATKFGRTETNTRLLGGVYASLGNAYYFGAYGATRDIQKGLKYITKGAELGNVIAQEQLGSIYTGGDNDSIPTNILTSYYWYQTAGINGNQKAKKSPMLQKIDAFKKQLPYCIAQGEQLVAQSYIDGKAGLSQDKYQAKKYLTQAIALYKKEDKPSADELKYCPPQKGLDLKSAEKLLAGL